MIFIAFKYTKKQKQNLERMLRWNSLAMRGNSPLLHVFIITLYHVLYQQLQATDQFSNLNKYKYKYVNQYKYIYTNNSTFTCICTRCCPYLSSLTDLTAVSSLYFLRLSCYLSWFVLLQTLEN